VKKGHELKERITGGDQPVEAGLLSPIGGQIVFALIARQHRDLGFDLGESRTAAAPSALAGPRPWRENALPSAGGAFIDICRHRAPEASVEQAERVEGLLLVGLCIR